jgi:hypothetical protein
MTRLWPNGEPITVESDPDGAPRAFTWQGRTHLVQGIAKRWRVDTGWWHHPAVSPVPGRCGTNRRVWREYFKLSTRTGLLVILYRDLLTDRWYLQRLYD